MGSGAMMRAVVGLENWWIPMQVGAPDRAVTRMNNLSFWILPFAFSMMISTLFMEGGGPNFGWTFYAPLSTTYAPDSVTYFIFAVHLMGASSIMGSINIIATILNMRAPGMTLMKMPMFVWTWLITAYLLIAVMPVLAGAVTMLLALSRTSSQLLRVSNCSDTPLWFMRLHQLHSCPSSFGHTTCLP